MDADYPHRGSNFHADTHCSQSGSGIVIQLNASGGASPGPSQFNAFGRNFFAGNTGSAINEAQFGGGSNLFAPQTCVSGTCTVTLYASDSSVATAPPGPYTIAALPSAVTFAGSCVSVTGSTTGNILACSNGTVWQWVKDGTTVTTMADPANDWLAPVSKAA